MYRKLIMKGLFISLCTVWISACEKLSNDSVAELPPLLPEQNVEYLAYSRFLNSLATNHVLPAYQQLQQAAIVFKQTVRNQCEVEPSIELQWGEAQSKWQELNAKWQVIQWLRLGPITNNNLHTRLQYWPDANGAVERGVAKLFAQNSAPSLTQLSNMNVGSQGLPAAEIILFGQQYQSVDMQPKLCQLLEVITENITDMTQNLVDEWQVSGDFYQQFVTGQGEFNGVKDTFEELFSSWVTQLTLIKDNKLLYPLGISSPGILALTESPHADISGQNVHINLLALKVALQSSTNNEQNGLEALLIQMQGDSSIAQRIQVKLDDAINISAEFAVPYRKQIAEEAGRKKVKRLIEILNQLQDLLSVDMVLALKLNIGFNSLDGD